MNLKDIKELLKVFDKSGLSRLKIKEDGFEIVMKKADGVSVVKSAPDSQASQTPVVAPSVEESEPTKKGEYITSPMVGTFYRAPSPDSPPFVKVGDVVNKGQTIGIIEAMKIFNEIEAEFDCKILEILVEDGQPVEYDMPLFLVERV
jgi:acetyl-CoA carboxylase biotin carboxyl carrier protein